LSVGVGGGWPGVPEVCPPRNPQATPRQPPGNPLSTPNRWRQDSVGSWVKKGCNFLFFPSNRKISLRFALGEQVGRNV